jgi:hypothetical protein
MAHSWLRSRSKFVAEIAHVHHVTLSAGIMRAGSRHCCRCLDSKFKLLSTHVCLCTTDLLSRTSEYTTRKYFQAEVSMTEDTGVGGAENDLAHLRLRRQAPRGLSGDNIDPPLVGVWGKTEPPFWGFGVVPRRPAARRCAAAGGAAHGRAGATACAASVQHAARRSR